MKAYIFKSKRARRMLEEYCISSQWIKQLQGKTFPVYRITETSCTIQIPGNVWGTWHIPLEACNIIDFPSTMED